AHVGELRLSERRAARSRRWYECAYILWSNERRHGGERFFHRKHRTRDDQRCDDEQLAVVERRSGYIGARRSEPEFRHLDGYERNVARERIIRQRRCDGLRRRAWWHRHDFR